MENDSSINFSNKLWLQKIYAITNNKWLNKGHLKHKNDLKLISVVVLRSVLGGNQSWTKWMGSFVLQLSNKVDYKHFEIVV